MGEAGIKSINEQSFVYGCLIFILTKSCDDDDDDEAAADDADDNNDDKDNVVWDVFIALLPLKLNMALCSEKWF